MKCFLVCLLFTFSFLVIPVFGQTFQECGDVTEDGSVNLSDMSKMIDVLLGGPDLPAGRGDIDFRQNFNLGDIQYLAGYLFQVWPEGGCPPFPSYTLLDSPDSLFLPEVSIPIGSGSMIVPIIIKSNEPMTGLLITANVVATNCTASIGDVTFVNWPTQVKVDFVSAEQLTLLWTTFAAYQVLPAGVTAIASVPINYSNSTGGTVRLEPATFSQYRSIHQVYGGGDFSSYAPFKIGVPHVVVGPVAALPAMSVVPDSLYFGILAGSGDPAAQTFDVVSDGDAFNWSASAPAWITTTPSSSASGTTVTVQPHVAGLNAGVHTGTIAVSSGTVYNSPRNVKVVLKIQAQYPAFDANCDGIFNISDIIVLILYIFGGPAPCDPCSGGTLP